MTSWSVPGVGCSNPLFRQPASVHKYSSPHRPSSSPPSHSLMKQKPKLNNNNNNNETKPKSKWIKKKTYFDENRITLKKSRISNFPSISNFFQCQYSFFDLLKHFQRLCIVHVFLMGFITPPQSCGRVILSVFLCVC